MEYQGADQGYQTLCTYYMADIHQLRPDWELLESLRRSIQFLWYFAHPDGAFGGLYGSRCTRFYYPAGILSLADQIPEAKALSEYMLHSIDRQQVVTISAVDEPNLIPMFNCYCWAAALAHRSSSQSQEGNQTDLTLPSSSPKPFRKHFPEAGLIVDRGKSHYTVVSHHKGGVTYHFVGDELKVLDAGVVMKNSVGQLGSSQGWNSRNDLSLDEDGMTVESTLSSMPKQLPGPWKFLLLRILCCTFFRFPKLRDWMKQKLVRILITGARKWPVRNKRRIRFGEDLKIDDETHAPVGYSLQEDISYFVPIHMASQGYWQLQDERRISPSSQ